MKESRRETEIWFEETYLAARLQNAMNQCQTIGQPPMPEHSRANDVVELCRRQIASKIRRAQERYAWNASGLGVHQEVVGEDDTCDRILSSQKVSKPLGETPAAAS